MKSGKRATYQVPACVWCGKPFEAAYYHRQYCSGKCRTAASRAKAKQVSILSDGYLEIWQRVEALSPETLSLLQALYDKNDKETVCASLRVAKSLLVSLGHWR
jgi:hypothetical protein